MAWQIEFHPEAAKELTKLGRAEAGRIIKTLETRIAPLADPRILSAPLKGEHDGH